jgi:putative flippase GtrA
MGTMEIINKNKPTKKQNYQQMFRFFWFSVSAGVIQTLSFTFLFEVFNLKYWVAYLPALVLSVIWNFTLNRKFTFKSVANIPRAMFKIAVYYAIFTPLSTWWGNALDLIGWNAYLILFVTMVSNLVTEFLVNRFFIYHNKMYTAEIKETMMAEEIEIATEAMEEESLIES